MTNAFHFGGSVILRMTVGTAQMSLPTAVSDGSCLDSHFLLSQCENTVYCFICSG